MHTIFNNKISNNFFIIVLRSIIYGILGLFTGIIVNKFSIKTSSLLKNDWMVKIFIQLFYCSCVLAFIYVFISEDFIKGLQNLTSGLFFVVMFFGVQYSMFDFNKIL